MACAPLSREARRPSQPPRSRRGAPAQTHSCMQKACMVSGTPHVRLLPARAGRDWALDPADLEAAVESDVAAGLIPFYLVATFGTTSSCAVDPLRPLGELAARHGMWRAPRSWEH